MATRKADRLYYQAEAAAGVELLAACPSLEDAKRFVAHYTRRKWWLKLVPNEEIELRYVQRVEFSGTYKVRGGFIIKLGLNRLHEGILIHELAHVVSWNAALRGRDHGKMFAEAHLALMGQMTSPEHVKRFRAELERRGII